MTASPHDRRGARPDPTDVAAAGRIDDVLHDRIDGLARTIDLRDGSVDAVRRRGEQRSRRHRVAVGSLSAVAVVSVAIAGIAVLSRPVRPAVSGNVPGAASGASGDPTEIASASAPTPLDSTQADPTQGDPAQADSSQAGSIPTVEPAIDWNVVRPGSTEALAYPGLVTASTSANGPVFAWSSQPGRASNDEWNATMYRSDDGVTWAQVKGAGALPGTLTAGTFPDGLYSLGTSPAKADGSTAITAPSGSIDTSSPTELAFWTSADGSDWTMQPVPLDLASWTGIEGVVAARVGETSVSATATSVLVLARAALQFDTSAVADADDSVTVTPSGVDVTRYDCTAIDAEGVPMTTVPGPILGPDGGAIPADSVPVESVPADTVAAESVTVGTATVDTATAVTIFTDSAASRCEPVTGVVEHFSLDAAGIDPVAVEEQYAVHLFHRDADGSFSEVKLPVLTSPGTVVGSARVLPVGEGHALVYDEVDPSTYAPVATHLLLSDDGVTWVDRSLPTDAATQAWGLTVGVLPDGNLAVLDLWGAKGNQPTAWTSPDGGATWSSISLGGLLRADDGGTATFAPSSGIVDRTGITVVTAIATDPIAERGPISIERDGLRISIVDSLGVYIFTDLATGAEIGRIDLSTVDPATSDSVRFEDDGTIVLLDVADGTEIARLTADDQAKLSEAMWGGGVTQPFVVLHSVDGVSWSRESLDDLSGVDGSVPSQAFSIDGRVILTVLDGVTRNDDGSAQTVVVVGTPTG